MNSADDWIRDKVSILKSVNFDNPVSEFLNDSTDDYVMKRVFFS